MTDADEPGYAYVGDMRPDMVEYMMETIDQGHEILDEAENDMGEAFRLLHNQLVDVVDILTAEADIDNNEFRLGMAEGFARAMLSMHGVLMAYKGRVAQ